MYRKPLENVAYQFVLTSPAVLAFLGWFARYEVSGRIFAVLSGSASSRKGERTKFERKKETQMWHIFMLKLLRIILTCHCLVETWISKYRRL